MNKSRHKTGRGVRIAVVDSGIHASHPHVGGVAGGIALLANCARSDDFIDRLGHGTAVAAAIREKAPHADLFAIKIFETNLTSHVASLTDAIDWSVANHMHVVNLSLGTSNPDHRIRLSEAVGRAKGADCIIVAAKEDGGVAWLPGDLNDVLGVRVDWDCPRDDYRFERGESGSVIFRASGYPRPIPGVPPDRNLSGISFAVANMTGFAARALEDYPGMGIERLSRILEANIS